MNNVQSEPARLETLAGQLFDSFADAYHGNDVVVHSPMARHNAVAAAVILAYERGSKAWAPVLDEEMQRRSVPLNFSERPAKVRRGLVRVAMYETGFTTRRANTPEEALELLTQLETISEK